ncbi:MAG: nucleotidyltransferase substrate binding protein [Planctomycetaceae bacterium]|jgi:hypothetical protein|nr:nucleotidyltransferase substrate binding protein [Planctomycetaceae bacterium]
MQQIRNTDKLTRAMKTLEDAISYARTANFQESDNSFKDILHAAVVQNFHLALNVCQKMLKYQLLQNSGESNNYQIGESDESLIIAAAKENLITNPQNWLEYLNSHYLTNSTPSAVRTYEKATNFLTDAKELLITCSKRKYNERRAA